MSDKTKAELKEQIKIMNHNYQVIREMHEKGYQYSVSEIKRLQDELDRTRKTLEQSETCCSEWEKQALDYKAENIALSGELELTRKALDKATDWLEQVATPEKCDDDLCREFTKRKLAEIKQITESPAENVQSDTKSRPVNVQTTYTADGTTRIFFGKKCKVEFDVPPAAQTYITITETRG